jgi:hypothetical protein
VQFFHQGQNLMENLGLGTGNFGGEGFSFHWGPSVTGDKGTPIT